MRYDNQTDDLYFGVKPGCMNERFNGYLDDIIIYDKPVDINEINTLHLIDTSTIGF